jgi:hypothetical protein
MEYCSRRQEMCNFFRTARSVLDWALRYYAFRRNIGADTLSNCRHGMVRAER